MFNGLHFGLDRGWEHLLIWGVVLIFGYPWYLGMSSFMRYPNFWIHLFFCEAFPFLGSPYFWFCLHFGVSFIFVKIIAGTRTHETKMRTHAMKCVHACLPLLCATGCTDFEKNFMGVHCYHMSLIFKFHKDPNSLRIYLQNNTDVCWIHNFQCIFTNIENSSPPRHQSVKFI